MVAEKKSANKDDKNNESNKDESKFENNDFINCGLIMPIANMPTYPQEQFKDVKAILVDAVNKITEFNFKTRLVSESSGEIDTIHKSIVNNIYNDPIVIVDISGRNGNVMLELGLRLAFDKPVIIIKDDKTDYMFDISMIEHINYPADLRHNKIQNFKESLQKKIVDTYKKSIEDETYSPFLKNFQHVTVKSIGDRTVNSEQMLDLLNQKVENMNNALSKNLNLSKKTLDVEDLYYSFFKTNLISSISNSYTIDQIPQDLSELKESLIEASTEIKKELINFLRDNNVKSIPSKEINDMLSEMRKHAMPF